MGEWKKYYSRVLDVDEPPFVGSVWIGYEPLKQVTDNHQPRAFPAWERFVIWKSGTPRCDLSELYPHVDIHLCLRKLQEARLQADESPGHKVSLYLTDYTAGREVFEQHKGDTLPDGIQVVGLPASLREPDDVHLSHPQ